MSASRYNQTVAASRISAVLIAFVIATGALLAQTAQGPAQPVVPARAATASSTNSGAVGAGQDVTLDTVVAIVNGDLILQSDVEAEKRFAAFQPLGEPKPVSQDQLIQRLIDRTLILQQMALQPGPPITDAEVEAELSSLRKTIPKCAAYRCETDAGWQRFVEDQGFTIAEVRERWRERMEVLRFIEERFRMGIRILPAEIDEYYKTTMIPAYQKENVTPPPEATIATRIQEILLQQRVDKLLDDWLTALRAQGGVQILKPGEEAP